jgi:endonuclease/exonuclease/phosphatase family metal-dependent hydrolase
VRLRLITYNIHKGIGGVDRRYRPERIIQTLHHCRADVALLQEVDDGVPRSDGHRQVDLLGDALGLPYRAYQANVRVGRGAYGNAILSRFPLEEIEHLDLTVGWKKRRRALVAWCRLPFGERCRLRVCNLHLGLAAFERRLQLRRLLESGMLALGHPTPVVAAGDFNDVYGTLGARLLEPAGFEAVRHGRTFPAALPLGGLDRVYFRGGLHAVASSAVSTAVARQASDHLPIVAEFEVRSPVDALAPSSGPGRATCGRLQAG